MPNSNGPRGPLDDLIRALFEMAQKTADSSADAFDLRKVLRFLTRVVQIVDDSFEEVYGLLIEAAFLTPQALAAGRNMELAREFKMLLAKSHFRDATEICSRLRYLADNYHTEIRPIMQQENIKIDEWGSIFRLIDAYEGSIINDIEALAKDVSRDLERLTESALDETRTACHEKAEKLRGDLEALRNFKGRILGLSGEQGLLELAAADRSELQRIIANIEVGRGATIVGGDSIQNVRGSTIVTRSTDTTIIQDSVLKDAMKRVEAMADSETANALKQVAELVTASGNKNATEAMQGLTEELAKEEPRKSLLRLYWDQIVKVLPDAAKLAGGVAALAKLFV